MKKIFSAFLLMTVMVFSVGTFVSCNDLKTEIEGVKTETTQNEADIKALTDRLAALQTELDAAEAKGDANAAEIASLKAQVKAVEESLATIEALGDDVDAVKAEIEKINAALEGKADAATVDLLNDILDEYTALTDDNAEAIAEIKEAIAALQNAEIDAEKFAEIVAKMAKIDGALVAFQNRLQSVSYVPEWVNGPKAVFFTEENEDYGYVHMSFEVAPKEYAANITAENTKLVGVPVKGIEVEEHDVKILNADPETGIVEVLGYIAKDSEIWKEAPARAASTTPNAALALRVVAEDAQVTSAYTMVQALYNKQSTIANAVFFGYYNEDGDFVTNTKNEDGDYVALEMLHKVAYDTPVAESEVAIFEDLVSRVYVEGFCDYIPVEEAAEMFGFDIKVTEVYSRYATKYFETTNNKVYDVVEDAKKEKDTPAFVITNDNSLDITVKFNEAAVKYLNDHETLTVMDMIGKEAKVVLHKNFFEVNGNKAANFAGITAKYVVDGLNEDLTITVSPAEIEWTKENAEAVVEGEPVVAKDLDVEGADARALKIKNTEWNFVDVDENGEPLSAEAKAKVDAVIAEIAVDFISVDNADAHIKLAAWPEEETTYYYAVTGTYTDNETQTTVTITYDFAVTVEAAPAGTEVSVTKEPVTLTLVKSNTYVPATEADTLNTYVPLTGVVEALLPTYKDYYKTEKIAKAAIESAIASKKVDIYVAEEGVMPEEPTFAAAAKYTYVAATEKTPVVSNIAIPYKNAQEVYAAMSKKYVRFAFDVELYGIVSTVVADYTVAEWKYKGTSPEEDMPYELVPVDTYSEVLRGTVPFTLTEETAYRYYKLDENTKEKVYETSKPSTTTGFFTEAAYNYWSFASAVESNYTFGEENIAVAGAPVENAVNLMKYFKLVTKEGQTPNLDDYTLVVELKTNVPEEGIANAPKIAFARTGASLAYPVATPLYEAKYNDKGKYDGNKGKFTISDFATSGEIEQLYLDWNGFKSNAVKVQVSLIKNYVVPAAGTKAPDGSNIECGTRTINLTHADIVSVPATAPADAQIVVYYDDINVSETVELAKGVRVFAADGKTPLYNLAASAWNNVFGAYTNTINGFAGKDDKAPTYTAGNWTTYFNTVYGLTANFVNKLDEDGEPIVGKYVYTCSDANFDDTEDNTDLVSFDAANGQLVITHDTTLNLNRDITFTIPVKIGHMFTYTGKSTNIQVVVKPGHAPVE